ncbi:MAG: hypothetical protein ACTSYI_09940 [Promethearchaeota archaeon]
MNATTLDDIRKKGYKALEEALGIVGMIRFLQQFEIGGGNYTNDRKKWLDSLSLEEIVGKIEKK